MDADDELFYQEVRQEATLEYFEMVSETVQEIFKDSIQQNVYDFYSPTEYQRTYALLNSVKVHIDSENGCLYVYCDTNEGLYQSAVTKEDVSTDVPKWIMDTGHQDDTGIDDEYHNYAVRNVLESAKQQIEEELDLEVEIISDEDEFNNFIM